MKNLKLLSILFTGLFFMNTAEAKKETITVKSSMICGMCEDAIRDGLAFEKGIMRVTTDLDNNEITVKYNPKKISAEEIKQKISDLGYDADEIPADSVAHDKLPDCCQKGSSCDGDMKK